MTVSAQMSFDKTFTHHTASVNGVRLHYVMGGKGEPLVLLHGWPATWREWRRIMPALAERYTVIVPDMRGLGDSSKPEGGYDKKTVAEDIYQLVGKLGFKHIFLVGHDWGMTVAYMYAAAHPEDVRRLVLLEALMPGLGFDLEDAGRNGQWHTLFNSVRNIPEALVAGRERIYLDYFYKELAYNPAAITEEEIDEYVRAYSAPGAMRAGFEWYRTIPEDGKQVREYVKKKLRMPVLALGGSNNLGDRVLKTAQQVAENVRGSVLEHCGHWIAEEQPEELTQQLLSFFAEEK